MIIIAAALLYYYSHIIIGYSLQTMNAFCIAFCIIMDSQIGNKNKIEEEKGEELHQNIMVLLFAFAKLINTSRFLFAPSTAGIIKNK